MFENLAAIAVIEKLNTNIFQPLIYLMMGVAVLYFLWGVLQFIQNSTSDTERTKGINHMLWGVFGFFIMISVYGIMWLVCNTVQCL